MKVSEQIKNLIEKGQTVFSCAVGRIGQVTDVRQGDVFIDSVKGFRAVTTFDQGDKVKVVPSECPDYDWQVINHGVNK